VPPVPTVKRMGSLQTENIQPPILPLSDRAQESAASILFKKRMETWRSSHIHGGDAGTINHYDCVGLQAEHMISPQVSSA